jgi:L-glyceraldehyde 3-phosphate reductase
MLSFEGGTGPRRSAGSSADETGVALPPTHRPPRAHLAGVAHSSRATPRISLVVYQADDRRYDKAEFRRSGRSGLKLPLISLGLWQNFGGSRPYELGRQIARRAFDLGVTHFDLANNYGPPYGSAEENFGRILTDDLRPYRDELVISTKAGYDMWPGPYGDLGSRKYLLASLDQSLGRMGLDYVDIFYSHRFDPDTPLEETMSALVSAVQQGKALYVGISSYSPIKTREAAEMLKQAGVPLLIHQPSYSMLNRWIEPELLDALDEVGAGCIAFSPLAQGLLTDKYLNGVPKGSRASQHGSLQPDHLSEENLARVRGLNGIAQQRGQSLSQLALSWVLRDARVTSALIGVSSVEQLEQNLAALDAAPLTADELAEVDKFAVESGLDLWRPSRVAG